jgi:hypothetical protein
MSRYDLSSPVFDVPVDSIHRDKGLIKGITVERKYKWAGQPRRGWRVPQTQE